MMPLSKEPTGEFYAVHKKRPFYGDLIEYMTSRPIMVPVLEGEGAATKTREVIGATNPVEAAAGTIRADFATAITENALQGSDATETAATRIAFLLAGDGLCLRKR